MKLLNIIKLILVIFLLTNCSNEVSEDIQTKNEENSEIDENIKENSNKISTDENIEKTLENSEIYGNFNWVIIPGISFGEILINSTEDDLVNIYSEDNVTTDDINEGEGSFRIATILFGNTSNETIIFWKDESKNPEKIIINQEGSDWIINSNIKIGTTLDELVEINNSDFTLTGFAWDYGGTILSWENGNLEEFEGIIIRLSGDFENLSGEEQKQISGDFELRSDNEILKKMNCKISEIVFYF